MFVNLAGTTVNLDEVAAYTSPDTDRIVLIMKSGERIFIDGDYMTALKFVIPFLNTYFDTFTTDEALKEKDVIKKAEGT